MNPTPLFELQADDGHRWQLAGRRPARARAALLWLPALGVAARHYERFAEALADRGIAVLLHEWRGNGSSSLRPSRQHDWGYREILQQDLPASHRQLRTWAGDMPLLIGGHSLGGQLASCYAGLQPSSFSRLWLVASGTPGWQSFPPPMRYALPAVYRFLPWLARVHGTLPGKRIGFGGTEARGLITDWARVGLTDHYAARGLSEDLEAALRELNVPVDAVLLEHDRLAPGTSLRALTARMKGPTHLQLLSAERLGTRADHFAWMKQPAAVAEALQGSIP
ncbi:MAG TPA: alpha/beta fold hydrolase [Stenotrophomonas sp.]|jgi:predicted alpha/beta hydrolase